MKTHVFRLQPNQDLLVEIDAFAKRKHIQSGCILACVGNLKKATIRMSDERVTETYRGSLEIISLNGIIVQGNSHLHIAIADKNGLVIGGHLREDSLIFMTAEIVIGELEDVTLTRKFDKGTGFEELVVEK